MGIGISKKQKIVGLVGGSIGAVAFGTGLASASEDAAFTVSVSTMSSDFDLGPYSLIVRCADGTTFSDSIDIGESSVFTRPNGQPMDCELDVDPSIEQQSVLRMSIGDSVEPSDGQIATSDPERIAPEGRRFSLQVDGEFVPIRITTLAPYLDETAGPFEVELSCADGFSRVESMAPTDSKTILLPGETELDCGAEVLFDEAQAARFVATYRDSLGVSSGRLASGQAASVAYGLWGSDLAIQIAISEPLADQRGR